MVLFKTGLDFKLLDTTTHSSFELLECTMKNKNTQYKFALIYRPTPSKKNKATIGQFLNEFQDYLIDTSTKTGNLYILGDFNIHVNNKSDKEATKFMNIIDSCNLVQLVTTSTHEAGNTLDLVMTHSNDTLTKSLEVESNHISDHHSVVLYLKLDKPRHQQRTITYRKTKSMNIDDFKSDIIESGLTRQIEEATSVERKMTIFDTILTKILDQHAPLITKVITPKPDTKWFCNEIRIAKQRRRKAEETWRKSKLTVHKQIYIKEKNDTNQLINNCKKKHVRETIAQNKGNSKELYKIMNGLMKRDSPSASLPKHSSESDLADKFNTYFIDKIANIRTELDNNTNIDKSNNQILSTNPPLLSSFQPVSTEEITNIIMKAPNKCCKLDAIPTWLLKTCINEVAPSITSIANHSIENADFPPAFKEAIITPLLKKKNIDSDTLKNYRPISNLNFISKVIERIIVQRLDKHITNNSLSAPYQSAYRPGHSTETALLRVHNDVINQMQQNDNVTLLLLDLSAAFDTVDHGILLDRLQQSFGITDMALKWFTSYLTNRTQRVVINGNYSTPTTLDFGVPQGSVLGPYLFTIYTTPLSNIINSFSIDHHLYADDTQLYTPVSLNNYAASKQTLTNCVLTIKSWMTDNKLKLNDDKTELIVFRKKGKSIIMNDLAINDIIISNSPVVRNLGFYFDEFMNMEAHVTKLSQMIHYAIRSICHIRNLLDEDTCKMLVHALVTSRLDYCNSLLYGLPRSVVSRLQMLQNRTARVITKTKKSDHITPVLHALHWLPVEKRIDYKVACITFKCIHGMAPDYLKSLVNVYSPNRPLRSSNALQLERNICKTKFSERSFSSSAPLVWNSLSCQTRNCQTLSSFRKSLKTELFRSAFEPNC